MDRSVRGVAAQRRTESRPSGQWTGQEARWAALRTDVRRRDVRPRDVHSPDPPAACPERVGPAGAWEGGPAAASDAAREEDRVADREEASEDGPAAASDAAREEVPVAGREEVPVAGREGVSGDGPAAASGAGREEVPGDARVGRNGDCRVAARARRDAVRSRYGPVRCYPDCCRRGNSRTNLQ